MPLFSCLTSQLSARAVWALDDKLCCKGKQSQYVKGELKDSLHWFLWFVVLFPLVFHWPSLPHFTFFKIWLHLSFSSFPVSALKNRFLSLWFTDSTSCWLSRWSRLSINVSPCAGTNSVTKMSDRILCQNATVRRGKREQKKGKPDTPSLFKNWGCLF